MTRRYRLVAAIFLVALGSRAAAADAPACADPARYPYPQAAAAAEAWRSAASPAFLRGVLTEYCTAATRVAEEKGLSNEQVDRLSGNVLRKLLDKEADDTNQRPTTGALLRAELGAAGFSRPVLKRAARLAIRYEQEVDAFQLGADTFPKRALLLVPPGQVLVQGIRNGKPVCSDNLTLLAGREHRYTCAAGRP